MLRLKINGEAIEVTEGATVLDACQAHGISVPTMCYLAGHEHFTSCMVCVVKDVIMERLVPACSAPVTDGMAIETDTGEVHEARRVAVELLLSEHVGDCEGPCQRVCPAQINIPAVIRKLAGGDREGAANHYHGSKTDSGIPCLDCNARCEKPCRRRQIDDAVSIRALMLYAARGEGEDSPGVAHARRFNSVIGRLSDEEKSVFLAQASDAERAEPSDQAVGFNAEAATNEATRCLHCDCRKPEGCRLRRYAELYSAKQSRYKAGEWKPVEIVRQHAGVVYEPGKCIKCGICVKLTEHSREPLGLAFLDRGYDVVVGVPFDEPLDRGLTETTEACVRDCPTGALSFCDDEASAKDDEA